MGPGSRERTIIVELVSNLEVLARVNLVLTAGTEVVIADSVSRIYTAAIAVATRLASAVEIVASSSARVRSRGPHVLIGFSEIPLRAPVASDAVGIAIVLAISVPVITALVFAGGRDQVDS